MRLLLKNITDANDAITNFTAVVKDQNEGLLNDVKNMRKFTTMQVESTKNNVIGILETTYQRAVDIFETAVSRSKDKVVASNREITRETKESIQELKELLSKTEEAIAIFVCIAQKKKDNEEKRKFHGKAKSEQRMAKTKQELIEDGKRVLKGDNEGE